jgi:hypothetical protein
LEVEGYEELAALGAYSEAMQYRTSDIDAVVEYARLQGVRYVHAYVRVCVARVHCCAPWVGSLTNFSSRMSYPFSVW